MSYVRYLGGVYLRRNIKTIRLVSLILVLVLLIAATLEVDKDLEF